MYFFLRYATPSRETLAEVPLDDWPDHQLCPHPKDIAGTQKLKEKYRKFYEEQDGSLKLVSSIAKGRVRSPPPQTQEDDDDDTQLNVTSQELEDLRKQLRTIKSKKKLDPLDTSDEEQDDISDPNKIAENDSLRRATAGYNSNEPIKIGLEELYNLKEVANQLDARWKDEGRSPFWEDATTNIIVDPTPNDFFFRDLSKVTHQVR
ncbi:MAG TPA: hypothetical protein VH878_06105 [Thermodesulfobacteriota bacterium]